MKFLVLWPNYDGRLSVNQNYKGISRIDNPLSVVNDQARFVEEVYVEIENNIDLLSPDGPYIPDVELAEKASKIYTACDKVGQSFVVHEVVYPFETPKVKTKFLGYDVLVEGDSVVAYALGSDSNLLQWQLNLKVEFEQRLNESCLFFNIEDAFDFYKVFRQSHMTSDLSILGLYI